LALDTIDNRPVKLISIPTRRASNAAFTAPDVEPGPITIGVDLNSERPLSVPISWERLQFRNATAKNYRRAASQQLYRLNVVVTATLADGSTATVARAFSTPIVVRGSTPRSYQVRKESSVPARRLSLNTVHQDIGPRPENHSHNPSTVAELYCPPIPGILNEFGSRLDTCPYKSDRDSGETHGEKTTTAGEVILPSSHLLADAHQISSTGLDTTEDQFLRGDLSSSEPSPTGDIVLGHASEKVIEDATLTYEYYPLSIDDWFVPIEAIYRPHYIHQQDARPDTLLTSGNKRFYKRRS